MPDNTKKPEADPGDSTHNSRLGQSMAEAARRAGFDAASDGAAISGRTIIAAMGGIRGIVEAVLPGLLFLTVFTLTRELGISLIAPVAASALFTVARVIQKQPIIQAVSGFVGIAFSAALALLTGRAEHFYLPGFITNAAYGAVLLISVLVRWPLIGLAAGFLMGDGIAWRKDPVKNRMLTILTLVWVAMFTLRLAVQLPLYFAGNVDALGATRLIMGVPLYAPVLILSWLMVRSVYRVPRPSPQLSSQPDDTSRRLDN